MKCWRLLSSLACFLLLAKQNAWTVLQNVDFPGNTPRQPYGAGASAEDCANQCFLRNDCVAISWNGPNSRVHDLNCNFKCTTKGQHRDDGEEAVIVRPGENLCNPPAPTPEDLCPKSEMPFDEWYIQCMNGNLLFSSSPTAGLWPEIGNGFIATVVQSDTIFAAGLFNGADVDSTHRARIPAIDFKPAGRGRTSTSFKTGRALDLQNALFMQVSAPLENVRVVETWYAPFQQPSLIVHEIELTNLGNSMVDVEISSIYPMGGPSKDLDLVTVLNSSNKIILQGSNKVVGIPGTNHTFVSFAANLLPKSVMIPAGNESVTLYSLISIALSLNTSNTTSTSNAILTKYMDNDFKMAKLLRSEHSLLWKARSDAGHIEVTGNLDLAQAANASLYFIRSSIRPDWHYGLSPGGLASDSYNGHTFWDQETWMWPPLLMLEPKSAASALQYRFDRQQGAHAKAASCSSDTSSNTAYCQPGFDAPPNALMFPWESAFTGHEAQMSGGKIAQWGRYEQHISGDIALAVQQYFYTHGDVEWLRHIGFPLVNGTATFYANRLELDAVGNFHYNGVMGPDEFAFPVNDSAYTNVITKITLEFAAEAAKILGYSGPIYNRFLDMAANLVVPFNQSVPGRPDLHAGYHPEYAKFPRNPRNPTVKQADTIMLSYPLDLNMSADVLADDLSFYDGITDQNGPAMTWSLFAIGWLNQGKNASKSRHYFSRGYANVQPPFKVWTETPNGGAVNFITGAGGFLQSLVFGSSGMRIKRDGLVFRPPAPSSCDAKVTKFSVHSFHFQGCRLRQEVTNESVVVELLDDCNTTLAVCSHATTESESVLKPGEPIEFDRTAIKLYRIQ